MSEDIESCTTTVESAPTFELQGREVQLFDSPGFDDSQMKPHEVLRRISQALEDQ